MTAWMTVIFIHIILIAAYPPHFGLGNHNNAECGSMNVE